jgi:hypothetical protein
MCDGLATHTSDYYAGRLFFRKTDGTLWGCGHDDGTCYMGNGTAPGVAASPVKVILPAGVVITKLGNSNSTSHATTMLGATADGRAFTWGFNSNNNIMQWSTGGMLIPVEVYLPPVY